MMSIHNGLKKTFLTTLNLEKNYLKNLSFPRQQLYSAQLLVIIVGL